MPTRADAALPSSVIPRRAPVSARDGSSLAAFLRLLRYIGPHRGYAALTLVFGAVGAAVLLFGISWKLALACIVLFPLYGLVFAALHPWLGKP
jgi:hypothetical protein